MSESNEINISADDDLMTRAENIVRLFGYRGAVGNFVLDLYRLLQAYEKLDAAANQDKETGR